MRTDDREAVKMLFIIVCIFALWVAANLFLKVVFSERTRLDEERFEDLGEIHTSIRIFWRCRGQLPKNLTELREAGHFVEVADPKGNPYGLKVVSERAFKLCSIIAGRDGHGYLRCFVYTIEPDLPPRLPFSEDVRRGFCRYRA